MRKAKFLAIPILILALASCGIEEWVKTAQQILPIVLPMVTNLVTATSLLEGKTISASDLTIISQTSSQVSADLNLAGQLVNQYESSHSVTIVEKINTTLADVNTHLSTLLPAMHVSDVATVQKITAITTLISSEVTSIEQILPLVSGGEARTVAHPAVLLSAEQLKKQYNAIVSQRTLNTEVDAAFAGAVLK